MKNNSSENIQKLIDFSNEVGIQISFEEAEKLVVYMNYILDCNQYVNLTAIMEDEEFIIKHLIDSMIISKLPEFIKSETVIDIGTGAGFPGIPLAVLASKKRFLLVDSLLKRIKIVNEGIDLLQLNNVSTIHARGENLSLNSIFENGADLVIARAVASINKLAKYTLPNVKTGGFVIALKGPSVEEEIQEAKNTIKKLGGKIVRVQDLSFGELKHNAVICKKIK